MSGGPQAMGDQPRIALFVTCLVDLFRPSAAFAALKLLEEAGCAVEVPEAQTCCGQPAYNSGDRNGAAAILRQVIETFEDYDAVVVPSGSCAGMLRRHGPFLLEDDAEWARRAAALADRTYELTQFLVHHAPRPIAPPALDEAVTYHDSCSALREIGLDAEPRALLGRIPGLSLCELEGREECCGFGGLFAVKYPDISEAMVIAKAKAAEASGAGLLVGPDLGCLLNIAGKLKRGGSPIKVRHIAELLAGAMDAPAIGDGD